ncbi:NAD-dependent epimerase/dehydratase family protein [Candidatus Pelagibacter sp.]|nr:NAD-dependent epimerase/dehydratase family protein [Candidatus Pelagibacter sp.]
MKKKLLITGSSGFVGNLFLKDALKNGYYVVDVLRDRNRKNKNLNHLRKIYPKLYKSIFYKKFKDINKKLKNKKFDSFINFATLYKNSHFNNEIQSFIDSNIVFPSVILDTIVVKVKKIINLGTMMQHIDGKNYIPQNFYASTKSAFEMICAYFIKENKHIKYYNLKFYESYSELDKRKKLIPTLHKNFKKNKTTEIITRNLELNVIHTDDLIKSIHLLLKRNIKSGNYCLKNNKNIKIKELIKSINRKSQKPLKVKFLGSNSIKPNKNFLKTLPNWKADITIQKKIEKYFYHETN